MCVGKVMSHVIPLCSRHLGWSTVYFAHSSDDGDAAVVSQLLNFVETCARVEGQWRNVRVGFQVGEAVNTVAPQHQRERVVELAGAPDQTVEDGVVGQRLPPPGGDVELRQTAFDRRAMVY